MGLFSRLFSKKTAAPAQTNGAEESAARFAQWMARRFERTIPLGFSCIADMDVALEEAAASGQPIHAALAEDAAAFLGESARRELGGEWSDDPLLGVVVSGVGGLARMKLRPYECVQKKWEFRAGLRLAEFTSKLPARIAAERALPETHARTPLEMLRDCAGTSGADADAHAEQFAAEWRAHWKTKFAQELPTNMRGLREIEAFLRTHFLVFGLSAGELACAGFHLGETMRGLFGGHWDFRADDIARAALVYPELPFYPVGRIMKTMIELPEGEPFDEYARMIPSARAAVRNGA